MSSGSVVFAVVVAVVVAGGAVLAARRVQARADDTEVEARELAGAGTVRMVDSRARFVTRRSVGRSARGNGTLLLSDDVLVWVMASPRRAWTLDRSRLLGATTCAELDHQSVGRPLLRVDHLDEDGQADASAWAVDDPDAWVAVLGPAVDPA